MKIDYRTRANKGRGFKSKLLFDTMHYGPFYRNLSNFTTFICTKFGKTHLFLAISKGAATIQERPLLVRIR